MKLSDEQKQKINQWAAEGATLNDIQSRLKSELEISITYMEARLLLIDLGINLIERPREEPKKQPEPEPALQQEDADGFYEDEAGDAGQAADFADDAPAGGNVTVTMDQVAIPGMMVSGKVTFSDGKTASWYLDQYGQLGMRAPEKGYQPPEADIPVFQRELQRVLA
jgi:hypothetical protein